MTFARVLGFCFGVAAILTISCGDGGSDSTGNTNTSNTNPNAAGAGGGDGDGDQPFEETCGDVPCCDTDADCSGDTPYCGPDLGVCVACTVATEEEDCGDYSCAHWEGACTERLRNAKEVCFACEQDSDCQYPMNCVSETFDGQELPPACIYFQARAGRCPSRYDYPREATSVDGVTAMHCFPPPTTTCRAVYERNVASCESHDECGVDGLDDGYCSERGVCTILCASDADCSDCSGDPAYCH